MVLWLLLSLDMIGMFHIILLWYYPYVIPTIARCYNPQVVFFLVLVLLVGCRVDLWLCCGVSHNSFLSYRTTHPRIYLRNEKWDTCKNYSFHCIITTNHQPMKHDHSKTLYKGLAQCIIGDQKRAYIGIIDIWCSCLVVWYYIFIWLLVLFCRCCTFFHLQGAFLTHGNYFRKIGAREKGGGCGISSVLFIFLTTPPIYEVVAFHLLSCVRSPVWSFYVVLLKCVELKYIAFNLPCARFILFVICGAACLLIMRYRAF